MIDKTKGLTITVELSDKTKAEIGEIRRQIAEVAEESAKIREFARMLYLWQFGSEEEMSTCTECPCKRQCVTSNRCEFPDYAAVRARELAVIDA